MIERIIPPGVPIPKSPYSPAVRAGDFIFVSGQGPNDPVTNQMSFGDIKHETRVVLNSFTSGQRIWRRVRAISAAGPGPWSDPAVKIVP